MIKREGTIILGNIKIKKEVNHNCISYYREGIYHRKYFPGLIDYNKNILYEIIWIREDSWHRKAGPACIWFREDGICLRWYREDKFIKKMEVRR